jgi:hypothetical protein
MHLNRSAARQSEVNNQKHSEGKIAAAPSSFDLEDLLMLMSRVSCRRAFRCTEGYPGRGERSFQLGNNVGASWFQDSAPSRNRCVPIELETPIPRLHRDRGSARLAATRGTPKRTRCSTTFRHAHHRSAILTTALFAVPGDMLCWKKRARAQREVEVPHLIPHGDT